MFKSPLHKVSVFVFVVVVVVVFVVVFVSCSKPTTPKPYGYFRIAMPEAAYETFSTTYAQFAINKMAKVVYPTPDNADFLNICYPDLNATIHCTYLPVHRNMPALLSDAQQMVYSHAIKASAIPEQEYMDAMHHVYGMLYELQGNTATPIQFYVTDSTRHFFRASAYINTIPNQDSLAPVIDYLLTDTRILMESFQWK